MEFTREIMSMDFSIFFTYNYLTKKIPSNRCSIYAKSTRDWIIFLTSEKDWKIFHKIPSNCCSIYAKSRRDWKIFLTSEKDKPISDFFAEIPTYNRVMGILRKIKSEIKKSLPTHERQGPIPISRHERRSREWLEIGIGPCLE